MRTRISTFRIMLLLCSLTTASYSQIHPSSVSQTAVNMGYRDTVFTVRYGEQYFVDIRKDGSVSSTSFDPLEAVNIIVEFTEEPFFLQTGKPFHTVEFYTSRFPTFTAQLRTLVAKAFVLSKRTRSYTEQQRTFYKTFFGTAVTVPRIAINDILSLPNVKRIHHDAVVKATVNDTRRIVGADSLWAQFGTQGDSIVVGIIDTGIDYTHPALGGSFGPAFTVIGGYDLYNNDSDPFDDHGHGTHVAGIVAANSDSVMGIAPKARLMAFKVLSSGGYGSQSTVIGGIERASDPNDDNDPSDRVDIANLSLGGEGTPDDAVSTAVNNAVALGIIVCAAAGNGISFQSIGSPAAAEHAITVGATEKNNTIAYFSSKGPAPVSFAMKPDLLAPGAGILSSLPGNAFEEKSGTSMATPVVAGVCALLKSINKTATPAMVKSALMSSAVSIGQEAMVQGAGRIDAFAAAKQTAFSSPAELSFGLDSAQLPVWTTSRPVWITNTSAQTQTFTFSTAPLPAGVSITSEPAGTTIASGNAAKLDITITVNNSIVPYPKNVSLAYDGTVSFNGTADTLTLPWSFVKASILIFTSSAPVFSSAVTNSNISARLTASNDISNTYTAVVPKGVYDLYLAYLSMDKLRVVIKEHVTVEAVTHLQADPSEAQHSITPSFVDPLGKPLPMSDKFLTIAFPESSIFRASNFIGSYFIDSMLFSSISSRFSIQYREMAVNNDLHALYFPFSLLRGIGNDTTVANTPSDYRLVRVRADLPPASVPQVLTSRLTGIGIVKLGENYLGIGLSSAPQLVMNGPWWEGVFYLMNSDPDAPQAGGFEIQRGGTPPYYFGSDLWMSSPPLRVINDTVVSSKHFISPFPKPVFAPGDLLKFHRSPVYADGYALHNIYGNSSIYHVPNFFGALDGDRSFLHSMLTIAHDNGTVIFNDSLLNSEPMNAVPGRYRSVITFHDYDIGGTLGNASLIQSFDLRKNDANSPVITGLKLMKSGESLTSGFTKNDSGWLDISSADLSTYRSLLNIPGISYVSIAEDSTAFFYRQTGTAAWKELSSKKIFHSFKGMPPVGTRYSVDLSETTTNDSSAVDLLARFVDLSGNTTEWMMSPAYAVGNYVTPVSVEENAYRRDGAIPDSYMLYQNFPNPFNPETAIMYDVPEGGFVSITVFDLLGRTIATLAGNEHRPGRYVVRWKGRSQNGQAVSSGIYFYRIEAPRFVQTRKMIVTK